MPERKLPIPEAATVLQPAAVPYRALSTETDSGQSPRIGISPTPGAESRKYRADALELEMRSYATLTALAAAK